MSLEAGPERLCIVVRGEQPRPLTRPDALVSPIFNQAPCSPREGIISNGKADCVSNQYTYYCALSNPSFDATWQTSLVSLRLKMPPGFNLKLMPLHPSKRIKGGIDCQE